MEPSILQNALFEDLSSQGLFPNGIETFITSDCSPKQAAAISLTKSLLKKWAPSGISDSAASAALDVFIRANESCGLRDPSEVGDDVLLATFSRCMEDLLDWRISDDSASLFWIVADRLKPGPGSALNHNNTGGFLEKYFQGPVSVTSETLLSYYRAMIFRQPSWAAAELQRYHEFGVEIVDFNRLFFAPKNSEIARTCCTEPGINMLIQQGVGQHILDRLLEWGIYLPQQDSLNKNLARQGSVNDDLVTIDLKSASDSISLALVDKFVPKSLRTWLYLSRSPYCLLPDGKKLELKMVSTMGNGFTFPLQTAIFTCIVRAVHILKGIPFKIGKDKQWGVFGDDIIVRKDLNAAVQRLLYLLGFTVNVDKSFTNGPFRESCGGDYFLGYNVRGVYLRSLNSAPDVYSALNRLIRWSCRHGIILKRLCRYLRSLIRGELALVPRAESDDAGLHMPSEHCTFLVPGDPSPVYKKYAAVQRLRTIDPSGAEAAGYGFAISVALLGGYISSRERAITDSFMGKITISIDSDDDPAHSQVVPFGEPLLAPLRAHQVTRYRKVSASTLWWDWGGLQQDDSRRLDGSWGAVVWLNLFSN